MRYSAMTRATRFGLLLCLNIGLCLNTALADRTTTYTYTAQGQVETIDGPRIDVTDITTYGYDTQGNRTSITNALGQATQITAHDAAGRPLTVLSPNNLTTTLSYDARGRLTQQSLSDSVTTRTTLYGYDAVGNLTQVTQPDGSFISYEYDPAHRLIGMEDNQGNRIDYTLDAMGNRLTEQVRDPQGILTRTQQRVYDELGQVHQLFDSQSHTTEYGYDANGNTTQTTDANLNPSNQDYDPLDRLTQHTDALNGLTQYQYDAQDNLISVTDPNGLATTYTYDGLDNLTQLTSPDTGTTIYTYDEAGNRLSLTDARGITVTYSYDAINRLTAIHYPDTSLDISYTYDQGANGIGQLTSMSDAQGNTDYAYDAYGHLISQTRTSSDSIVTTFGYAYDAHGRLLSLTYPSGRIVHYGYGTDGQLITLTLEKTDDSTQALVSNLQTLPFGPTKAFDFGNGLSLIRTFDHDYRLTTQQLTSVLNSQYNYDPVGNISDWLDLLNTSRNQLFDYDKLDRLTAALGAYGDLGYSYDATGNRLTLTEDSNTETYTYVPNSHRLQQVVGGVTDSRSYDDAGNTIQSLMGSYTYDDTNRMTGFSKVGTQADYAYNGKGERIQKNVNGTITRFRYSPAGLLLGEYDQNGQSIREYVTLENQPIALITVDLVTATDAVYYLHTDHLGAVVKATDSAQTLVWDADRRPFGGRTVTTAQIEMPLGFPGQYYDQESGLYYNYFRDYDPATGRYLQSDPIGLEGGINTYSYVLNNPLRWTDPTGEAIPLVWWGASGIATVVAGWAASNAWQDSSDWDGISPDGTFPDSAADDRPNCPPENDKDDCEKEMKVCHRKCADNCVGMGYGSSANACYRRCVRTCLPGHCAENY